MGDAPINAINCGATNLLTSAEAESLVDTDFMQERKRMPAGLLQRARFAQ
jgi:hypothetical protein